MYHHEVECRPERTACDIDLGKVVPRARSVAHVHVEGQVLVVLLVGMKTQGVDCSVAHAELVHIAVHVDGGIVAYLAVDVTEVNVVARHITRDDAVGAASQVEHKFWQGFLQAVDVKIAGLVLLLGDA